MLRAFQIGLIMIAMSIQCSGEEVTLLITGQTNGLLEPCGCENVEGGMEARAGFLESFRAENDSFALIDLGEFVDKEVNEINKALGITYLQACNEMGYDFVNLSSADLRFGYEYLSKISEKVQLPLLSTSVLSERSPFWKTSIVKEMKGLKIGFLGASSLMQKAGLKIEDFNLSDPTEPLRAEAETLRERDEVDVIVLLACEPPPIVIQWLEDYKGPKIDLAATFEFGIQPQLVKDTYLVNVPSKGYGIGKITLDVEKGKGVTKVDYERVSLKPETYENENMREYLSQAYQRMIQDLGLQLERTAVLQNLPEEKEDFAGYAGATFCMDCHYDQYEQWSQTRHARAFDDLLNQNRHWVPECVMCHVTGYGNAGGYISFGRSERLRHVQCETCHGPGQKHADDMGTSPIRRGEKKELCVQCHDEKNSPKFDEMYDLYYKKIQH